MFYKLYSVLKKDNLLEQSFQETTKCVNILKEMFHYSVNELRYESDNSDFNIYNKDKSVNEFEREIRRNSLTHLALNDQEDLSAVLVLLTIIHDFERIGDYLKNIYELSTKTKKKLVVEAYEDHIKQVEKSILKVFESLGSDISNIEKETARELVEDLNNGKKQIDTDIDEILESANNSSMNSQDLIISVMYLRFLKRILSHLANISSSFVNPFDRIGFEE